MMGAAVTFVQAKVLAALCFGLFVGCTLKEPRFNDNPQPIVKPETFSSGVLHTKGVQNVPWWEAFQDPLLHELISAAREGNFSVQEGAARLAQAYALSSEARGLRFPQIELSSPNEYRISPDGRSDSAARAGGSFFWDPDLFGGLQAEEIARRMEVRASSFALQETWLAVSSELARTYFAALEQKQQLQLLKEQVKIDSELLDLVRRNFEAGVVSRLDLLQQQGQLAETKSLIPRTESGLRVFENRIDVLLGQASDSAERLPDTASFPAVSPIPEGGVPSDLLLSRPDLQAKRAALAAADVRVEKAISERLPRFVLSGRSLVAVGSGPAGVLTEIMASLTQPLLTWGVREAEVELRKAAYEEQLYDFSRAYLLAIEEAENSLYRLAKQGEYVQRLEQRRSILADTLEEAKARYSSGLTDYLPVLDTLQQLRAVERDIVAQKRVLLDDHLSLLVALGGGVIAEP